MARSYARLAAAIWDDPEFRALPADAQLTYVMLVSQREISMCGVLTVATHRWAGFTTGSTTKSVERALRALHDARFVVLDLEAGEVLVRTFVRHNDVWKSANTAKAAARAFGAIHSASIRNKVTAQVPKAVRHLWPEALLHTTAKALKDLLIPGDTEAPPEDPLDDPTHDPTEGASEGAYDAPDQAPHRSLPETGDLRPEESSSNSPMRSKPPAPKPDDDDDPRIAAALDAIVDDLEAEVTAAGRPPTSPEAWRRKVRADVERRYRPTIAEVSTWPAHTTSDARTLADLARRSCDEPAVGTHGVWPAQPGRPVTPGRWELDDNGNATTWIPDDSPGPAGEWDPPPFGTDQIGASA